MSLMTTALEITDKQVTFVRNLAAERDWSKLDVKSVRIIKIVTRPDEDGNLTAPVDRKDASNLINKLLAAAKIESAVVAPSKKYAAQDLLDDLPASYKGCKYAVKNTDKNATNTWVFYEVREYKGKKYLNRLQGSVGDWNRTFVNYADYAGVVERIKTAEFVTADGEHLTGPKAAAWKFSDLYEVCAACGAKLSNNVSLAQAMGPVCAKKF